MSQEGGTQESVSNSAASSSKPQRLCFVLLPARALLCCGKPDVHNIVSIVILCDLRAKVSTRS